jgi:2-C-methyl-D-erythritol 4-phosphate cytidylyltransferase
MTAKCAALVAAGGTGSRVGAGLPKQLVPLLDKPLFVWCLEVFLQVERIVEIVVAVPAGYEGEFQRAASGIARIKWVRGGARRQDSVRAALGLVSAGVDLVMVHDAARPLITSALICRLIDAADVHGAAIPVLPVAETLKQVDGERVIATVDRRGLFSAQTPQAFRTQILKQAFESVPGDLNWTDESSMAEAAGIGVAAVPGELRNIKVTFQEDFNLAAHLLGSS